MENVESGVGWSSSTSLDGETRAGLRLEFVIIVSSYILLYCLLVESSLSTQYFDICIEGLYSFPGGCGKPEYFIFLNLKIYI